MLVTYLQKQEKVLCFAKRKGYNRQMAEGGYAMEEKGAETEKGNGRI